MAANQTPDHDDVVHYLVAMIQPLVDVAVLARMDKTARLLEAAVETASRDRPAGAAS